MSIPSDYLERCYAGWLGKIIGVRFGAPIEGWTYDIIREKYGELKNYTFDYNDFAADDDTNGPMFFLRSLNDYGINATAEQMGLTWLNYAPYEHGFFWWGGYNISTEHTAYTNLRAGISAPRSGSIEQNGLAVAEQIGGQIFCDTWGLVAPANPTLAADYADRGASVSHDGNGRYGAKFVAAAISAAFTERNIYKVIDIALNCIPYECEYNKMARDIKAFYISEPNDWRLCFEHIRNNWGYDKYPGNCHIIPNSAVMQLALLYGNGDYSETICICNMCGWDTDCNVGNVGAIVGTLTGIDGIEAKWREPVHDFLAASSAIGSLNIMDIPQCAYEIARLACKIANEPCPEQINVPHGFYDFEMPYSTHSLRSDNCNFVNTDIKAHSGKRSLYVTSNENKSKIWLNTYYVPSDFTDNRYAPEFSPILYAGQTVSVYIMTLEEDIKTSMFADNLQNETVVSTEPTFLKAGIWNKLTLKIDCSPDNIIKRVGIDISSKSAIKLYIDDLYLGGKAEFRVDYSKATVNSWNHIETMTLHKGFWNLENGVLSGSGAADSDIFTGYYYWNDYSVDAKITPITGDAFRLLFRVQGAVRSYAVTLSDGRLSIEKNSNGFKKLASVPFEYSMKKAIKLRVEAYGNRLKVSCNNISFEVLDNDAPYLYGQVGFAVYNGRINVHSIKVCN